MTPLVESDAHRRAQSALARVGRRGTLREKPDGPQGVIAAAPQPLALRAHQLHAPAEIAEHGDGLQPGELVAALGLDPRLDHGY